MLPTDPAVPLLETPRLRLREFRADDVDALFAIHGDPRVMRYWSHPAWTERRQAEDRLAEILLQSRRDDVHPWAIADRDSDRLIGSATLFAINREQGRAEVGYSLHADWQGRGLASEALARVLAFAFDEIGLRRIEADIDPRNEPSCRLVEKFGFVREGLLRRRWQVDGETCDTAFYGLLREELVRT